MSTRPDERSARACTPLDTASAGTPRQTLLLEGSPQYRSDLRTNDFASILRDNGVAFCSGHGPDCDELAGVKSAGHVQGVRRGLAKQVVARVWKRSTSPHPAVQQGGTTGRCLDRVRTRRIGQFQHGSTAVGGSGTGIAPPVPNRAEAIPEPRVGPPVITSAGGVAIRGQTKNGFQPGR